MCSGETFLKIAAPPRSARGGEAAGVQYRPGDDVLTLADTKPTEAKLTDSP